MIATDLSDERDRRRRKALRLLCVDVRQARLHATYAECLALNHLVDDCQAQIVTPDDARAFVLRMRAAQTARMAA